MATAQQNQAIKAAAPIKTAIDNLTLSLISLQPLSAVDALTLETTRATLTTIYNTWYSLANATVASLIDSLEREMMP